MNALIRQGLDPSSRSHGSERVCPAYEFVGYRLDVAQHRLVSPLGESIDLPCRAYATLRYLVERAGELVEKSALMTAVWPNTVVEENNLSQCVRTLRQALGESPEHRFILTVRGRGFQFVAPVKVVHAVEADGEVDAHGGMGPHFALADRAAAVAHGVVAESEAGASPVVTHGLAAGAPAPLEGEIPARVRGWPLHAWLIVSAAASLAFATAILTTWLMSRRPYDGLVCPATYQAMSAQGDSSQR